jgi:nucleotide-binding universal stress UspA family protein
MKILLAIDDSEYSRAAVEAVADRTLRKEVRVLHVLTPVKQVMGEMAAEIGDTSALEQAELTQGKALVEEAAERLRAAHLNVSTAVEEGDPKSKILDHAEQWHADVIVLGSHGRKGIDRFLLGSVSDAVARHAPCSVEIVRLPEQAKKAKRAA